MVSKNKLEDKKNSEKIILPTIAKINKKTQKKKKNKKIKNKSTPITKANVSADINKVEVNKDENANSELKEIKKNVPLSLDEESHPETKTPVKPLDKKKNVPFRRIKEEEVDVNILKKIGKNAFDYKKGAAGSWGEKASKDLIVTRGKSFRHEKNKKKRGSYRGGKIDTNSYSIKFDDSD